VPEVDFYVLIEAGEAGVLRAACGVTEQGWAQGLRVYVLARDDDEATRFDELLWTLRADSFVPHERWNGDGEPTARVTVSALDSPPATPDLLVNLGAPVPAWFRDCRRIAEFVGADAPLKEAGRHRYREYREAGAQLRMHEVQP
jgi:DNA polymerase-3 subunit chi